MTTPTEPNAQPERPDYLDDSVRLSNKDCRRAYTPAGCGCPPDRCWYHEQTNARHNGIRAESFHTWLRRNRPAPTETDAKLSGEAEPAALRPLYDTSPVYRATYEAFFSAFKRWPARAKDAVSLKQVRELARFTAESAHYNHQRRLYSCDPAPENPTP